MVSRVKFPTPQSLRRKSEAAFSEPVSDIHSYDPNPNPNQLASNESFQSSSFSSSDFSIGSNDPVVKECDSFFENCSFDPFLNKIRQKRMVK